MHRPTHSMNSLMDLDSSSRILEDIDKENILPMEFRDAKNIVSTKTLSVNNHNNENKKNLNSSVLALVNSNNSHIDMTSNSNCGSSTSVVNKAKHRSALSDVTSKIENKHSIVDQSTNRKNHTSSYVPQRKPSSKTSHMTGQSNKPSLHTESRGNTLGSSSPEVNEKQFQLEEESESVTPQPNENENDTNEYSTVEEDDNNDIIREPLQPICNANSRNLLEESHKRYYRSVPDPMDEDTYDVVMVSEISNEIFDYLRVLEEKYKPNPNYMHYQENLKWSYRRILLDWIVEVHNRFQLLPETLYLTVNIIDRFLSKKSIILDKFQLIGASALFVASKYEEINCPTIKEIIYMLNGTYTRHDIIEAEKYIIDTLEFEIGWPGPMSFLRRISKADDYEYDIRTLAKYLLESTIMDSKLVSAQPSWLAAGSYFLSKVLLGYNTWSQKHIFYSGYTQQQILPLASLILDNCRSAPEHHNAIYEKYSQRRYGNCSQIVTRWILDTECNISNK